MSGTNSSSPAGAPDAEGLTFTVHGLPPPNLALQQRQTRVGRIKMLLVLAFCAAPVLASYFMYYVVRPEGRSNYGQLVQPTRSIPALTVPDLAGRPVPLASLRGQWLLMAAGPADCSAACLERQHALRQLRQMLGKEKERLDKVWFITDAQSAVALPDPKDANDPSAHVLRMGAAELQRWLGVADVAGLESHLFLVDPMGELMMRFPLPFEPTKVKRDLERLLRASASWDQAGR